MSLLALVFIAVHVMAVAVDPFTHFGLTAVLVPFASHYRPVWMGLGIVALYLLLAVWVSSRLRRRIGHRLWRQIHVLAFAVYGAATLHGLGTGSDTRTIWAGALYAASVALVGSLLAVRLLAPAGRNAGAARSSREQRPLPSSRSPPGRSAARSRAGWSARAGGTAARRGVASPPASVAPRPARRPRPPSCTCRSLPAMRAASPSSR